MRRALAALIVLASWPAPSLAAAFDTALPQDRPAAFSLDAAGPALPALPANAISNGPEDGSLPLTALPIGAMPAVATVPAAAQAASARAAAPQARAVLSAAAAAAVRTAAHPGSIETDRRRVDFTRPLAPETQDPVLAGPSQANAPALAAPRSPSDPPASEPPAPSRSGVKTYLASVFAGQIANNALVVSLPIVLLGMTRSLASLGYVTAVTTGMDMAGTLFGGWLAKSVSSRALLVGASAARAAALASLPVMLASGAGLPAIVAVFCLDAFSRGICDTARNTVSMAFAGRDKRALDWINTRYQTVFELGGVAGPLLTVALAVAKHPALSLSASAAGYALAGLGYLFSVPRGKTPPQGVGDLSRPAAAPKQARKSPFRDPFIRASLLTTGLLSLTPALKALLPAIFASSMLGSAGASSWLVLAFGMGSTAGSFLYERLSRRFGQGRLIGLAAAGAAVMASAWVPASFPIMAAGCLLFAAANASGRLAVTTALQARIPEGSEGPVIGAQRFIANKMSLVVRMLMGLAFTGSATRGLTLVAAGLALAAAGQFVMARKLPALALMAGLAAAPRTPPAAGPRPSPVTGYPGRLIAVEGLDGSGKSTQMERLKERLEAQGLKVVVTTWNSSDFVSEAVKKAKKAQKLTPRTFALLNAADFQERLESTIVPALKEGCVVLADRWFFTALARDSVRGNDQRWLRGLYQEAPRPDLTLYFKLPVDTAIGRVLKRSGKPSLSEDFDDGAAKPAAGPKHYEAGLDLHLSDDPIENFRLFQTRVTASYDAQIGEFGLRTIDASRSPDQVEAEVSPQVEAVLGELSAYAKADDAGDANLFDKDPAGDAPEIRRNYMKEKKGAHLYFRNMLEPMQRRFSQLIDHRDMPKVFLHGSPHVDNYAKSAQGAAMIDFDRSRMGPYAWDLVRALVSVSLRRKKQGAELLDPAAARSLLKGYLRGLRHSDRPFSEMRKLKDREPSQDEASTSAYLKANGKWAQEMRQDPVSPENRTVRSLISQWAQSRGDDPLKDYFIEEAGRGRGSMGQRKIYLVVLAPKEKKSGRDRIFLSIKQARTDADTRWYENTYPTQAQRMIAASELYAPGWDQYQGSAVLDEVEYHVRAIPPFNAKLKKMLDDEEQRDFLYAVGTQLGRAHRLSVQGDPALLEAHVRDHFDDIIEAGRVIRDEIAAAHRRYLRAMKARGLAPSADSESDE